MTKREQILFCALFFIFITVLVKKGAYELRAVLNRLDEEISMKERELAKLKRVLRRAGAINAEYDEAFLGYKGLRGSDNLLQQLGAAARSMDFNILGMKPALIENTALYRAYAIRIEGQDDIATLAGFLYKLTEGLKGIGVEQLQVKAQSGEELPRISMTLNAVIFK